MPQPQTAQELEDKARLDFFMSHSPSEILRLATLFDSMVLNDKPDRENVVDLGIIRSAAA